MFAVQHRHRLRLLLRVARLHLGMIVINIVVDFSDISVFG